MFSILIQPNISVIIASTFVSSKYLNHVPNVGLPAGVVHWNYIGQLTRIAQIAKVYGNVSLFHKYESEQVTVLPECC
jgi:hypothetical protein